ncbi:NADAR family protein [Paenibacillus sp. SGZ-1009]|uniref:NADAR family protein n=1 Tax=Paenibacillus campi TaxID=3106031 RepID=UPI003A4C78A9
MFWGHTPKAVGSIDQSCFSQWWNSPFTINSVTYSCTEQYMMAEKARLFGDMDMLANIMAVWQPGIRSR